MFADQWNLPDTECSGMKYWSSQILFRLSDSFLQFKVMVLTLSLGLVLSFLEGGVSSSFIIADSHCFLGQIWSIHYLLIASRLHCFQDDEHWNHWDISSLRTYKDIEVVVFHASYLHTTVIQGRHTFASYLLQYMLVPQRAEEWLGIPVGWVRWCGLTLLNLVWVGLNNS